MNTEVLKKEGEVDKHEVVGLMKGTGHLYSFIKYFGIMPWEIKDDYKFAYDQFGVLNFYTRLNPPLKWESIWVFTRIRKELKRKPGYVKDALKYMWPFK